MNNNPLYPSNDTTNASDTINQMSQNRSSGNNSAADVIREKLARIYSEAPDPYQEERQPEVIKPRSKHQQFMHGLSTSGKSLAQIQTEWHRYYTELPDEEKHEVWHEFYEANGIAQEQETAKLDKSSSTTKPLPTIQEQVHTTFNSQPLNSPLQPQPQQEIFVSKPWEIPRTDNRSFTQIKSVIRDKVTAGGKLRAKHHIQSLAFGLAAGLIVLVIFLFGFFNEVIIAPFIQPARLASATPIIVDPSSVTVSSTPEIIIPKINLEIPVDFTQTSTNESTIENALEDGIVHYPSTVMPGQNGNSAFFGHSSNNIFNPGKYKFAFVLLHELVPGDTFYITYNGKVYIYKVSSKQVVDPSDIGVLNNIPGKVATATLITCDPPGTSLHRLVVVGDQISPDPVSNSGGTNTSAVSVTSSQLPTDGPSLWSRIWHSIF